MFFTFQNVCIFIRFNEMFSDNELWLATITNPMFKLQWLDKEEDIERAKNMLICEYKRLKGIPQQPPS